MLLKTSLVKDSMFFLSSQEYYDQLRRIASKFSRSSLREKVADVGLYSINAPHPHPPDLTYSYLSRGLTETTGTRT